MVSLRLPSWLTSYAKLASVTSCIRPHRRPGIGADESQAVVECVPATEATVGPGARASAAVGTLHFDNGYGGFSADGREYVIRLQPDGAGGLHVPPIPWVNVIANEQAGFIVSESGAGYTWAGNSRLNRLTAWHNDPVCDPHSEVVWIRDEDAGEFWSVTPGPTPAPAEYVVRHGFGYTTVRARKSRARARDDDVHAAGRAGEDHTVAARES